MGNVGKYSIHGAYGIWSQVTGGLSLEIQKNPTGKTESTPLFFLEGPSWFLD